MMTFVVTQFIWPCNVYHKDFVTVIIAVISPPPMYPLVILPPTLLPGVSRVGVPPPCLSLLYCAHSFLWRSGKNVHDPWLKTWVDHCSWQEWGFQRGEERRQGGRRRVKREWKKAMLYTVHYNIPYRWLWVCLVWQWSYSSQTLWSKLLFLTCSPTLPLNTTRRTSSFSTIMLLTAVSYWKVFLASLPSCPREPCKWWCVHLLQIIIAAYSSSLPTTSSVPLLSSSTGGYWLRPFSEFDSDVAFTRQLVLEQNVFYLPGVLRIRGRNEERMRYTGEMDHKSSSRLTGTCCPHFTWSKINTVFCNHEMQSLL